MRRAKRLPREQLAPYLLDPPALPQAQEGLPSEPQVLAWSAVFGNDRPVEVEVGFGKGLFLLSTAGARPDVNLLGIEIARKYQLYVANRLAKRDLRNVRVACADARAFLAGHVAPESVQAVHVYFPDPWWKKRHLKRRLFGPAFAAACARVLRPAGTMHIVTDVAEYFQIMQEIMAQHTKMACLPPPSAQQPAHDLDYLTNFERKFRKEGRSIYRAGYAKNQGTV